MNQPDQNKEIQNTQLQYELEYFDKNFKKECLAFSEALDKLTSTLFAAHAGGLVAMLAFIGTTLTLFTGQSFIQMPFKEATLCFGFGVILIVCGNFISFIHRHLVLNKYKNALLLSPDIFHEKVMDGSIYNSIANKIKIEQVIFLMLPLIYLVSFILFFIGAYFTFEHLMILYESTDVIKLYKANIT